MKNKIILFLVCWFSHSFYLNKDGDIVRNYKKYNESCIQTGPSITYCLRSLFRFHKQAKNNHKNHQQTSFCNRETLFNPFVICILPWKCSIAMVSIPNKLNRIMENKSVGNLDYTKIANILFLYWSNPDKFV